MGFYSYSVGVRILVRGGSSHVPAKAIDDVELQDGLLTVTFSPEFANE